MLEHEIWVEVTTLIIPGYNDSERELKDIAGFLRGLSPDLPWHVSGFHPTYRLTDAASTPPAALRRARRIGQEAGLKYVYTGNLPGDEGENTFCPACRKTIIARSGFCLIDLQLRDGSCAFCGERIAGIWS
jgi:pyruvate formate lyase activating enzyme